MSSRAGGSVRRAWSCPVLVSPEPQPGLDTSRGTCSRKDRTCPGPGAFPCSSLPHPAEWNRVHACVGSWHRAQVIPPHLINCSRTGTFGTELGICKCHYSAGKVARAGPKPTTFAGFRLSLSPHHNGLWNARILTYTAQNIVSSLNECFISTLVQLQTPHFCRGLNIQF